jgi:hypothetical protein
MLKIYQATLIALLLIVSQNMAAEPRINFSEGKYLNGICEFEIMRDLEHNLRSEFCTLYGTFADSSEMESTWKDISHDLLPRDSSLMLDKPQIGPILAIKDMPEIIYFMLTFRDLPGSPLCAAYNRIQNRYYLLNDIDTKSLSDLLCTIKSTPKTYREIIEYCRLLTIIRYPGYSLKFLSSINELLMTALMRRVSTMDLERARTYEDIKIDIPMVTQNNNIIEVKYAFAKNKDIIQAYVKLKGNEVIDYKETIIGEMYDWYPWLRYLTR